MSPSTRRMRPGDPQAKVKTDLHLGPPPKELTPNSSLVKKVDLPDSYLARPTKKLVATTAPAASPPTFQFEAASAPARRRGYRGPSLGLALVACTLSAAVLLGLWHGRSPLPAADQMFGWLQPTEPGRGEVPVAIPVVVAAAEQKPPPLMTVEPVPEQAPEPVLVKEPEPEPPAVVVAPPPPPEPPVPVKVVKEEPVVCKLPRGTYGTSVSFQDDPVDAAQKALKDRKLFFVITISGNFEDSKFT